MESSENISIALAANHRYLPGLLATMASMILFASRKDILLFHVFADGLLEEDCERVRAVARRCGLIQDVVFHHPDMTRIKQLFKPYNGAHSTYLRLFLSDFLSENWVVYSDVDTLWFRDVVQFWAERDDAVSILWSKDLPSIAHGVRQYAKEYCPDFDVDRYACCGVALMNLKKMRANDLPQKCADFARQWGTPFFVDQDILNVLCLHDAKLLDQRWDCMMPDRDAVEGVVLHFNGIGKIFNGTMVGWRVLFVAWYRFYYDVIEETPSRPVCGMLKRFFFWLAGAFYPHWRFLCMTTSWLGDQVPDNLSRYMFFAWLYRRAKWWRRWGTPFVAGHEGE